MSDTKDLGRRLRDADPASGVQLDPRQQSRMREEVVRAASRSAPSAWRGWAPLIATATVIVVAAVIGWPHAMPRRVGLAVSNVAVVAGPLPEPPATALSPAAVIAPAAPTSPARMPRGPRLRLEGSQSVTRIDFTAPDGTRILWFSKLPRAKEDES